MCFALGFLAFARALDAALPPRHAGVISTKLDQLAANKDDYDLLFVGSSRVYRGVDPRVIEAQTGLRSYNLGLQRPGLFELYGVLRQVAEIGPTRVRWVVLEAHDSVWVEPENARSDRNIAFHDLRSTAFALRFAWGERNDWTQLWNHAAAFGRRTAGVGRLARALFRPSDPGDPAAQARMAEAHGFQSLARRGHLEERALAFDRQRRVWERTVAARPPFDPAGPGLRDHQLAGLRRVLEVIRRDIGAEPVALVPPTATLQYEHRRGHVQHFPDVPLLAFDDVQAHPDLYDSRLWFDEEHLAADGARRFSNQLGARLREIVGDHRGHSGR